MHYPYTKDTLRKHGQIIVDFTNADTTDKACLSYFSHIQDFLKFPSNFINKIKKIFPQNNSLPKSFSDTEKNFWEKYKDSIQRLLDADFTGFFYEDYDEVVSELNDDPVEIFDEILLVHGFEIDLIQNLETDIPIKKIKENWKVIANYNNTKNLHLALEGIQSSYRVILEKVTRGDLLHEIPSFVNFLKDYNNDNTFGKPSSTLTISNENYLIEIPAVYIQ